MGAKNKKTRKQKIIADYRRNLYTFENKSFSASNPIGVNPQIDVSSYSPSYVLKDIAKTTILTSLIIAGELILFFLLKKHILKIPGIDY